MGLWKLLTEIEQNRHVIQKESFIKLVQSSQILQVCGKIPSKKLHLHAILQRLINTQVTSFRRNLVGKCYKWYFCRIPKKDSSWMTVARRSFLAVWASEGCLWLLNDNGGNLAKAIFENCKTLWESSILERKPSQGSRSFRFPSKPLMSQNYLR